MSCSMRHLDPYIGSELISWWSLFISINVDIVGRYTLEASLGGTNRRLRGFKAARLRWSEGLWVWGLRFGL